MLSVLFDGRKPAFWFIIGMIALAMNITGLYLQHFMHMEPCVKCIDQRVALYLVSIFAFITSASNVHHIYFYSFRVVSLVAITYSSYLAVDYYLATIDPNIFAVSCALEPNLPTWLPLHQWIPDAFAATGMCGETNFKLFNIGLVQWTMIGCVSFAIYSLIGTLRLYQLFTHKNNW